MLAQATATVPYSFRMVAGALLAQDHGWSVALDGGGGELLARGGVWDSKNRRVPIRALRMALSGPPARSPRSLIRWPAPGRADGDIAHRRGKPQGRGLGPPAPGTGARAPGSASALDAGRSDAPGRAPAATATLSLVGPSGATGDCARLASATGATPLGRLSWSAPARPAADRSGMPRVDLADGPREPKLGLPADPCRALEAGPSFGCQHHPLDPAPGPDRARRPAFACDLEAIPGSACRDCGGRRFLQCGHRLLSPALRPRLLASRESPDTGSRLHARADRGLGDPAGPQPELEAR